MVKQNTSLSLSLLTIPPRGNSNQCAQWPGWHNAKYKTRDEGNTFLYLHISNEI